jgi:hypothetical protein
MLKSNKRFLVMKGVGIYIYKLIGLQVHENSVVLKLGANEECGIGKE